MRLRPEERRSMVVGELNMTARSTALTLAVQMLLAAPPSREAAAQLLKTADDLTEYILFGTGEI